MLFPNILYVAHTSTLEACLPILPAVIGGMLFCPLSCLEKALFEIFLGTFLLFIFSWTPFSKLEKVVELGLFSPSSKPFSFTVQDGCGSPRFSALSPHLLRASPPAPPLFLSFSTLCLIEAVPPCGTSSPRGWTWPAVPQPHPLRSGWTLPSISPLPLGVEAFQEHLSDPTFPLCRLIGHPVASSASSTEKPSPRSPLTSSSYSCAGT